MQYKNHKQVLSEFIDLFEIHEALIEASTQLEQAKDRNYYLHYAQQVLTKRFGVGDTIYKEGKTLKVIGFVNGMFIGSDLKSRSSKPIGIYEGWIKK